MALGIQNSLYLRATMSGTYISGADLSAPIQTLQVEAADVYSNGTGDSQVNRVFADQRTLAATAEDLDLSGGLTDAFGNTITLAKLRGLIIENTATATGANLLVGGDANSIPIFGAAADYIKIPPGGFFAWSGPVDGITVTAGTGDILQIDAGAATITYNIWVIGATA